MMTAVTESLRTAGQLCANAARFLRATWRVWAVSVMVLGALMVLLVPVDTLLLSEIQQPREHWAQACAGAVSKWGDFYRLNIALLIGGLALGYGRKSPAVRRGTLAVFLAALAAGIAVNMFRPTIGRPRPSAELPDGVYGPHMDHDYHGFPSGHASTAFATGVTVTILCPPAAIPALAGSTAIAWSRLQLNRHHPTDTIAGALLGTVLGTAFGVAAKRPGRRDFEPFTW